MPEFPDDLEFMQFSAWVRMQYGVFAPKDLGLTEANYKQSEHYRFWIQQNRPQERISPEPVQLTPRTLRIMGREVPEEELTDVERLFMEAGGRPQPSPAPEPDTIDAIWEQAERISERTGVPVADIYAKLTGTPLPEAPEGLPQMTPFQEATLRQREREFGQEERFRVEGLKEARANLETRRLANLLTPPPDFRRAQSELERARQFYEFESQRQAFLAEVRGQPRQFIAQFRARDMRNPFAPSPPRTMQDEIRGTEEEIAKLTVAKKAIDAIVKRAEHDPNISLTGAQRTRVEVINRALQTAESKLVEFVGSPEVLGKTGVAAAEELGVPIGGLGRLAYRVVTDPTNPEFANLTSEEIATLTDVARESGMVRAGPEGGFIVGEGGGAPAPPRFVLPELPKGIREFVPTYSRLTGEVGEIVSPSAQALGRLTFTEREQLAGVVEFGGGQFRDVLERVRRETPFAPRRVGRARAFRQRAGVTF